MTIQSMAEEVGSHEHQAWGTQTRHSGGGPLKMQNRNGVIRHQF